MLSHFFHGLFIYSTHTTECLEMIRNRLISLKWFAGVKPERNSNLCPPGEHHSVNSYTMAPNNYFI